MRMNVEMLSNAYVNTPKNTRATATTTLQRSTSCFVGHVTRLSSARTSLRNPKRRFFAAGFFSVFFSTLLLGAFSCLLPSAADCALFSD